MTAGSGIIHQEMPQQNEDFLEGFQLWVNLPSHAKMMNPKYQDLPVVKVPEVVLEDGVKIRVLAGTYAEKVGPVEDIIADPEYLDIMIPPQLEFKHPVKDGYTVFAYIYKGEGNFNTKKNVKEANLVIFESAGDHVIITTQSESIHFLLVSGKPIKEPIAWAGPIVMNTQEELQIAFNEYRNGTFLKKGKQGL
jgi:redox-sensitive bicupin YhaK (pirin superfamily)